MLKRYRRWRNRLTSEVAANVGGSHWRITKQGGEIVGIERWEPTEHTDPVWMYTVWKGQPDA